MIGRIEVWKNSNVIKILSIEVGFDYQRQEPPLQISNSDLSPLLNRREILGDNVPLIDLSANLLQCDSSVLTSIFFSKENLIKATSKNCVFHVN